MPAKTYDTKEARKRSVDNLQRLYTFVVSLAVTEMLRRMLNPPVTAYGPWLMFVSFLFTVVPFYHGANRYLDATYVTGERSAKHFALMFDFIFLFLEALLLFALAMQASNREWFYTLLGALFVFDAIWVGFTNLTGEHQIDKGPKYATWAVVNVLAAGAVSISVWSNLFGQFWANDVAKNVALVVIVISRTVYDYISVWSFYYPRGDDSPQYDNIPAPRPAPPPTGTAV